MCLLLGQLQRELESKCKTQPLPCASLRVHWLTSSLYLLYLFFINILEKGCIYLSLSGTNLSSPYNFSSDLQIISAYKLHKSVLGANITSDMYNMIISTRDFQKLSALLIIASKTSLSQINFNSRKGKTLRAYNKSVKPQEEECLRLILIRIMKILLDSTERPGPWSNS